MITTTMMRMGGIIMRSSILTMGVMMGGVGILIERMVGWYWSGKEVQECVRRCGAMIPLRLWKY